MGLIRFVYSIAIAVAFVEGRPSHKDTSKSVLVWLQKKPLVFTRSSGESSSDDDALEGLLPEIWPTVANRCREFLPRSYTEGYRRRRITKPLSRLTFLQEMGPVDLLMPVKLREKKENFLGLPFVKLLDSPGVAVIIKKALTGTDLFNAILMAWPILMFVVLSALLSGFFMWFLEYRSNPQMFDSFCPKGVLNGFWWAAVTMTTVGYGDITPKTILGRLFTIVWISVGLVILAMYMGVVTTSLTTTRLEGTQHFYGITVAAVNQTEEHKFAILQNTHLKVQEDELQVIDAVYNRKDGVKLGFVDFYLASYHSDTIYKKKLDIVRIIPREHAYGVLLGKDWSPEVVDCLRRHSGDNRHVIHKLIPKYIVGSEHKQRLTEYFSDSLFGYSIYVLSGFLCLLIFLGFCHDRGYCTANAKD